MKKFTSLTAIFLFIVLAVTSCSDEDDYTGFPYGGNWTGTYVGEKDKGTITITISPKGVIEGTAQTETYNDTYNITGRVSNNGNFAATTGTSSSNVAFTGTLIGNSGSGEWSGDLPGYSGTWTIEKK